MGNLSKRLITASILIILVYFALFHLYGIQFALAVYGLTIVALWEWTRLAGLKKKTSRALATILASVFIFIIGVYLSVATAYLSWALFLLLVINVLMLLGYPRFAFVWQNSFSTIYILGILLISCFAISCIVLHVYSPYRLLWLLSIVWINDSAAFFTGRSFGKHKLASNISPKKSWEGFMGGIIAGQIWALILPTLLPHQWQHYFAYDGLLVLAICVAAVFGDLFESMFKRAADVKDSSNLLPGHGGVLDRIDALLIAVPICATAMLLGV